MSVTMGKIIVILCGLLVAVNIFAADVEVQRCSKAPKVLHVKIGGESALNIFRAFSNLLNMKPISVGNFIGGGMNCDGKEFSSEGEVLKAECSYLIKGEINIPYPQHDPGFSHEEIVDCD